MLSSVPGYDFNPSGNQWNNPSRITFSFPADGVSWDQGTNNLGAIFDARFGAGIWERPIALALATWEASANINIVEVADANLPFNTLGQTQGDPRFGDIRIGGYAFAGNTTTLAQTYFPPPDGSTAAGDIEVNTSMDFNIGAPYDLYSVLLHETGHALGLDHAQNPADVMYATYSGIRPGLSAGDMAGIQTLYGPRVADAYQQQGLGLSVPTAIDLTTAVSKSHQATLTNTSLATIGDTEYFRVVAPNAPGESLQVTAAAGNLSLLSPSVSVIDASGNVLASQANPWTWGDNVSAQVNSIVPGQAYDIAVSGATTDAFAVGAYQLQVAFTSAAPPATVEGLSPPVAPDRFEPNNTFALATNLGLVGRTTLNGLTLSSPSDVDIFVFQAARAGSYQVSAPGTIVSVVDRFGHTIVAGAGQVGVWAARPRAKFYVVVAPPGSAPVARYTLSVSLQSPRVKVTAVGVGVRHAPGHSTHVQAPRTIVGHAANAGRSEIHIWGAPARPHG